MALSPAAVHAQVYAEQVLNIGRNVLAMDDYVLAIQYFNQAAASKPYLWDPYYYRALAKLMLDDFHGAEGDASLAIEKNKYKYEAYRVRGFARMRLSRDSAAIADFDRGLAYVPHDKYFLYYKGIAQASMNDFAGADTTLTRMLELYPGFEDGYVTRAQAHLLSADTTAALTDVASALHRNPNLQQPRLMRADIALQRHQWSAAAAELDSVINLNPADVSLYINRAYARYNADDWPGALADYNYALDIDASNYAALYNRALLRFQVQDLQGARQDFSAVLAHDPDDFPSRYNRGLINLNLADYKAALADFRLIAGKYPRFYPVYYAMSQAYQGLGNNKLATDYFFKANDLITRYTADPKHYKLDRPTISQGTTRTRDEDHRASDDPEEVMEHFNELVTISQQELDTPLYGEQLRGRVQDVDMRVQPESPASLSFFDPTDELITRAGSYSELADINNSAWLSRQLFLTGSAPTPQQPERIQEMFDFVASLDAAEASGTVMRPIDLLARAVALTALKNYERAIADLDRALAGNSSFVSALLQRAYLCQMQASGPATTSDPLMAEMQRKEKLTAAVADYDAALAVSPTLSYAHYGKGCALYKTEDYQGAVSAFSLAIEASPDMGRAYFNRALCFMRMGRRADAVADLSRAGELGIVAAYNLLKRV